MTREKLFTFLWATVLSFVVSFGAVSCIVTAFHMDVSLLLVALWCAGASLFASVCYSVPLGLLPISAFSLITGFLWHQGALRTSVESLLYRLSRQYHKAYDWDIIKLNYLTADDMELHLWLVLCMLGALVAIAISWAVCRKRPALPGLVLAGGMLSACLVVTDTVPGVFFLFLLFFGTVMLLLTGAVRRQDSARGNRLSTILALPVAVALLLLFLFIPANHYRGQEPTRKLADQIMDSEPVARLFGRVSEVGTTGSSVDSSIVNLKTVGVRLESSAEIMQVLTDYDTTLYLRGRALDSYDGETWTDSGTGTDGLYWPDEALLRSGGEVMITTKYAHRMMYLPYYVSSIDMNNVARGVENTKKLTQYSYSCLRPLQEGSSLVASTGGSMPANAENYLHLSKSVEKWAVPLAKEVTADCSTTYEKAIAIREYVKNSATYDTNTFRMPSGSSDFVRWFLEDSETGYCVHFASAATVLLQATGIPARYVTGYTTQANAAYLCVVRAKDAHAWAEYWLPGYGWMVLEATPPDAQEEEATTTAPTDETQPEQSRPTTEKDETQPQQAQGDNVGTEKVSAPAILKYLWLLPLLAALAALLWAQRYIRLQLRRRWLRSGTPNEQALRYWREVTYLTRLLGQTPDKALFLLAQKAKFSQYTTTQEELEEFATAVETLHFRLKQRNLFLQLYYRLILAVY